MNTPKPFVDFYSQNNISPVSQDISDLEMHFCRRTALYLHLGLPPILFADKHILEIGPGSGHNAIYTSSLHPRHYTFLDGNITGLDRTRSMMTTFGDYQKTKFEYIHDCIGGVKINDKWDIVLCEGVLPLQIDPIEMCIKISKYVKPRGVFVVTCADSVSYLGEMLRRLQARLQVNFSATTIQEQTLLLTEIFKSDLNSLVGMSRPHEDWVLDNIIQPFYGKPFSMLDAISALKENFVLIGSSPKIFNDWRWYKLINKNINASFSDVYENEYWSKLHQFIDHRAPITKGDVVINKKMKATCDEIFISILEYEKNGSDDMLKQVIVLVSSLVCLTEALSEITLKSLNSFLICLKTYLNNGFFIPNENFNAFFGKGQQYLSFYNNF
jgi:2-polyprenyl-3-methyl-5-hydroxy-6-metoxy-1,4-benzoquinol methylase